MFKFCILFASFFFTLPLSAQKLSIQHLTGDFFIYTTYMPIGNGILYPSNSMYLVTNLGVVLFDTPWDTSQVKPLLDSIEAKHQLPVIMCISTHFHDDRTAGLNILKSYGVKTYTSYKTTNLCLSIGNDTGDYPFDDDTTFVIGEYTFVTYYPGPGHSFDNIVVWFPSERILYGGCFIKSMDDNSIGNTSDAYLFDWDNSLRKVKRKFSNPQYVIPGHNSWQSNQAVDHTLNLVKEECKRIKKQYGKNILIRTYRNIFGFNIKN